jgi:hypothetical protein
MSPAFSEAATYESLYSLSVGELIGGQLFFQLYFFPGPVLPVSPPLPRANDFFGTSTLLPVGLAAGLFAAGLAAALAGGLAGGLAAALTAGLAALFIGIGFFVIGLATAFFFVLTTFVSDGLSAPFTTASNDDATSSAIAFDTIRLNFLRAALSGALNFPALALVSVVAFFAADFGADFFAGGIVISRKLD